MAVANHDPSVPGPVFGPWLLLGIAIAGEIAGALLLRVSEGFTRVGPTVAAMASFGVALFVVSRVMKVLPVSIAYPVWAGGGTAGAALSGVLLFGESLGAIKLAGVALVVVGVVVLNASSEKTSGC